MTGDYMLGSIWTGSRRDVSFPRAEDECTFLSMKNKKFFVWLNDSSRDILVQESRRKLPAWNREKIPIVAGSPRRC
jgi:hypothetical protein